MAGLSSLSSSLVALRDAVEAEARAFLVLSRKRFADVDDLAAGLVDEIVRLFDAGGKRLRPVFCVWGFRAGGGAHDDARILRAAAALELLHVMALIHDDVMDQSATRRGVPSSHVHLTEAARERGCDDPERIGLAEAVLAGDVAAVLADQLLLEAGFPAERLVDALAVYHVVRSEMAAGQELDLVGSDRDAGKVAHLKGGSYTVRGPLLVGAALAGATPEVREALIGFGDPLGEAFQLLDDLRDGDAADGVTHVRAHELARVGVERLTTAPLPPDALAALAALAAAVADA